MHVGALQLFMPPDGAGPDFARGAYDAMLECTEVQPMFRKHPAFLGGITNVAWSFDKEVELDYHLRQSALPRPGRVRELLELTSRLHGSLLDRHRPLWEAHLVEGLEDGRYAVYIKFHHSLLDGVSGLRLLQRAFTPDPNDREVRVPWNLEPRQSKNWSRARPLSDWSGIRWDPLWDCYLRHFRSPVLLCSNSSSPCRSGRRAPCSTSASAGRDGSRANPGRSTASEGSSPPRV